MLGKFPFKAGDEIRTRIPGNPKGIGTVLRVEDIRDADSDELICQHVCITAPLNCAEGVWTRIYPNDRPV